MTAIADQNLIATGEKRFTEDEQRREAEIKAAGSSTLDGEIRTERGDRIRLPEAPARCWCIGGEDAVAADSLYSRWRELRAELVDTEAAIQDKRAALAALEADAQEQHAQALINAAIIGTEADPKEAAKLDKALNKAREELKALESRAAILPRAVQSCARQWAQTASEVLLERLHQSSPAADELAARLETVIPQLISEWRSFTKQQERDVLGLAHIAEATSGSVMTAPCRALVGDSLLARIPVALQKSDPGFTLIAARRCSVTGASLNSGAYRARY